MTIHVQESRRPAAFVLLAATGYLFVAPPTTAAEVKRSEATTAPPTAPTHLRVNDVVHPVGTGASVDFGWHVNDPDPNEIQTQYQILVASSPSKLAANEGDIWDSGPVSSRLQNHVAFAGRKLESDRRYCWKVRTWDKDGNASPYSEPATFGVGLLDHSAWSGAAWIRRDSSEPDDYTCFRKTVPLPARTVERATAYISSTHKYALYVNGTLVGKGPAYHYPQYQYYNAHDITSLLATNNRNQFAIFNHWFGGGQGRPPGAPGVILKAIIHYADGSSAEVNTDGSWRQTRAAAWAPGQPQRNRGEGVGYVEQIDARLLNPDWTSASFDDSSWSAATVIGPLPSPPWTNGLAPDLTRIRETVIAPASVIDKGGGKYVVDLGKVWAGVPRIRFSGGAAGTMVEMRGGYILNASGEIDPRHNQVTDLSYRAILNGNTFIFEPVEYVGMRYFEISNSPMPVSASNFSFVVRHSDMDASRSSFASSDATLNAVWDLMKHSLFTCAQEEFVDTPTREKGGFLGDAALQSTVAMPVLNERALTRRVLGEYLQSMEQYWSDSTNRGRMNAVYPNRDGARDIPDFTQAYLPWVWNYYMETGDRAFLAENYARLKDIADYVHRHQDAGTGLVTNLTGGAGQYRHGIVDWPPAMRFGYDMSTAARTVINGWAYADYDTLARMAAELGNAADRDTCRARAEALKAAINKRLLNASGVYVDGLSAEGSPSTNVSQHANMFPLALGLVPAEHQADVLARIKELRMSVGMVTVPWLIRALGEADEGGHLVELFTNPEWSGWARCLAREATATWESWYSDAVSDESLSHAWGASGLEGYVRYVLGIKPLKPQYEEVQIKPLDFGGRLTWAKGSIATDRGEIAVDWKRSAESYAIHVNLPVNVTARIAVPRGAAAAPVLRLDGSPVRGSEDGRHLVVSGIGSGEHSLVRYDTPPSALIERSR